MAVVKGAKSIAEYAIRKWLLNQGFVMEYFELEVKDNEGLIKDRNGDSMVLVFDPITKTVFTED